MDMNAFMDIAVVMVASPISHLASHLASRISSFVLFVSLSRRRVASHLASRLVRLVTRLVPRRFVPRPRRYLVISLSRCRPDNVFVFFFHGSASAFVFVPQNFFLPHGRIQRREECLQRT
jgi:hypothetical protein